MVLPFHPQPIGGWRTPQAWPVRALHPCGYSDHVRDLQVAQTESTKQDPRYCWDGWGRDSLLPLGPLTLGCHKPKGESGPARRNVEAENGGEGQMSWEKYWQLGPTSNS